MCCPGISWDGEDCVILELVGMEKIVLYPGISWDGEDCVTLELVGMEKNV